MIDAQTGRIVKFESHDASGGRHELSDDEKANLAKKNQDGAIDALLAQAFEAGIACVLGGGVTPEADESKEDAELRNILLSALIERSPVRNLLEREVLGRAILGTLFQQSVQAPASEEGGRTHGLQ